jgi:acetoacetyl-CoA synthetase
MPMQKPSPANTPLIRLYQNWLSEHHGLSFDTADALWQWSVTDLEAFWQSIWEQEGFTSPTPHSAVLGSAHMPGAQWFPGAQVNYAQRVLRHVQAADAAGVQAIVSDNERGQAREMSWPELSRQVASMASSLKDLGVHRGDRVAAYLPNVPETIVAFLACASIGAIWSVCAPDMGTQAVTDRFRQISPKVLIAADGVFYAGKALDRSEVVQGLRASLPSVEKLIVLQSGHAANPVPCELGFAQAVARDDAAVQAFEPEWLPFDHPLWDRLFQRHHGPAQGPGAWPRRRLAHGGSGQLAQRHRLQPHAQQPGRALSLVQLHRLDHVELPGLGPARRRHHLPV